MKQGEGLAVEFTVFLEWAAHMGRRRGGQLFKNTPQPDIAGRGGGRPSANPLDAGMLGDAGRVGGEQTHCPLSQE